MGETGAVTMHDVAYRAGAAVSSVSRGLGSHPDVSPAMKTKSLRRPVHWATRQTQGHRACPMVSRGHLPGRDFANNPSGEITHGLQEALTEAGHSLLVKNLSGDTAREADRKTMLRQRKVTRSSLAACDSSAHRRSDARRGRDGASGCRARPRDDQGCRAPLGHSSYRLGSSRNLPPRPAGDRTTDGRLGRDM